MVVENNVFNFYFRYAEQFDKTSSHRLRNREDMQYSFSYFYYIIGEKTHTPVSTVFKQMDTDKSGYERLNV